MTHQEHVMLTADVKKECILMNIITAAQMAWYLKTVRMKQIVTLTADAKKECIQMNMMSVLLEPDEID
jgi:hypothetical protein